MLGSVVRLHGQTSPRTERLTSALRSMGLRNTFNPSALPLHGDWFVAFRALGASAAPPFHAYLLVVAEGKAPRLVSLTEHCAKYGIGTVADPKLLRLRDELWVTFNSGFSAREPNQLGLMRVAPELGEPYFCRYAQRQRVEKNWAFFSDGQALHALYSPGPVRILTCVDTDTKARTFEFASRAADADAGPAQPTAPLRNLTIGTQLAASGRNFRLVVHEKVHLGKRRGYWGRPATLVRAGDAFRLEVEKPRMVHSWASLLGPKVRHNPHLLFCTYFAGLCLDGGRALLSYGINDTDFAFADLEPNTLW